MGLRGPACVSSKGLFIGTAGDMCGIAGIVGDCRPAAREAVERMTAVLRHRGPDDGGIWHDQAAGIALGHRRLSIIDLSPAGHQPMHSPCGRYVIVFNGEIYNHLELRKQLAADYGSGLQPAEVSWRGHSDTEVLLVAISRWGILATLERIVGMFAIAVWDRQERTLHLVRDRLGEKPLYYGWLGRALVFGSELKALRAHPDWEREISRDSIALLLRHSYIPAPYSIYSNVRKLQPGTMMIVRAQSAQTETVTYWSPSLIAVKGVEQPCQQDENTLVTELDAILKHAVAQQMVADVPLGAFLSGGIDSSLIVALMQVQSSRPVKTFTIGFSEPGYNEAEDAKAVAQHLGTEHTELYLNSTEALSVIPKLPSLYDEPFSDSSQIPTFLVSSLTRRHVTVSLSGDGGDELFGGYNRYMLGSGRWGNTRRLPRRLCRIISSAIRAIPPLHWDATVHTIGRVVPHVMRYENPGDKLYKLAQTLDACDPEEIYLGLVSHWKDPESIVLGATEPGTAVTDRNRWADLPEFAQRMMYLDMISYLPDDILVKVDRAAMGVSLESRVPFLDHRVVEFAWRIPLSMKIRGRQGKWLLRQLLHKYVPRDLVDRPKKGFSVPIATWLRGALRDWAEGLLDPARLVREGFLDPKPIQQKWREHLSGSHNWQYHLWDVLMFQAWLEQQ